jgi:hypothetical protein
MQIESSTVTGEHTLQDTHTVDPIHTPSTIRVSSFYLCIPSACKVTQGEVIVLSSTSLKLTRVLAG